MSFPRLYEPCITSRVDWRECAPFCKVEETPAIAVGNCSSVGDDWTRGAVWKGGEVLARLLLASPDIVRGQSVLELGTGTGVAGLAAAAAGASAVMLTDQTVEQVERNLALNPELSRLVQIRTLRWGRPAPWLLAGAYDVVLAADVIYPTAAEDASLGALPALFSTLHIAVSGRGLLVYVERSSKVTVALHAELRRRGEWECRRRSLGLRIWLYTLDRHRASARGAVSVAAAAARPIDEEACV